MALFIYAPVVGIPRLGPNGFPVQPFAASFSSISTGESASGILTSTVSQRSMLYAVVFSRTDRDQLIHFCFLKYPSMIFRHVAEIDIRFCMPFTANTLYLPSTGLYISIATEPRLSSGLSGSSHDTHIQFGKTHGTNPNGRHHSVNSAKASSSVYLFLAIK